MQHEDQDASDDRTCVAASENHNSSFWSVQGWYFPLWVSIFTAALHRAPYHSDSRVKSPDGSRLCARVAWQRFTMTVSCSLSCCASRGYWVFFFGHVTIQKLFKLANSLGIFPRFETWIMEYRRKSFRRRWWRSWKSGSSFRMRLQFTMMKTSESFWALTFSFLVRVKKKNVLVQLAMLCPLLVCFNCCCVWNRATASQLTLNPHHNDDAECLPADDHHFLAQALLRDPCSFNDLVMEAAGTARRIRIRPYNFIAGLQSASGWQGGSWFENALLMASLSHTCNSIDWISRDEQYVHILTLILMKNIRVWQATGIQSGLQEILAQVVVLNHTQQCVWSRLVRCTNTYCHEGSEAFTLTEDTRACPHCKGDLSEDCRARVMYPGECLTLPQRCKLQHVLCLWS